MTICAGRCSEKAPEISNPEATPEHQPTTVLLPLPPKALEEQSGTGTAGQLPPKAIPRPRVRKQDEYTG